jgi:sucrose-phosphate synthase
VALLKKRDIIVNHVSSPVPTAPDKKFLLAADIDGTLLGDEEGESILKEFVRAFSSSFYFAVITGRSLTSVRALIDEGRLPQPDFISSSVGTELCDCQDTANMLGQKFTARVSNDWQSERIYGIGEGDGIRRQVFADDQPRFRAGFDWDGQTSTLDAFRKRLAAEPGCRVLPSYARFIDVFPPHVGKGEVARFLQQELGLDPARVVVAGDSGNDTEMFESGFKGVVPVNALDELKRAACQPWHYHSPLPAARGVMDGLLHFGFVRQ